MIKNCRVILAMIIYTRLTGYTLAAPMGPPNNPITMVRPIAEDLIDSGAHQSKMASDAIHNQMLAVTDLQTKQLAATGTQLAELATTGIQQTQMMGNAIQNQLMTAFLQQQQLASASIQAQKVAAEALHNQIISSIEFQQKLMSAGTQLPGVLMGAATQPVATLQQMVTGGQSSGAREQQPNLLQAMGAMGGMGGLDKMIALPFSLFGPLLTAAATGMATAGQGLATSALSSGMFPK